MAQSEKASLHYRLTVSIEVDGAILGGSATQAIEVVGVGSFSPTEATLRSDYYGDAIEIPLEGGGVVFATMANPGSGSYGPGLLRACGILDPYEGGTKAAAAVREFEGSCEADAGKVALLVYMSDPRDPNTMRNARQMKNIDIARVTLTTIDTAVTNDLSRTYTWLSSASARFSVQSDPHPITIFANVFSKKPPGEAAI